MAYPGFLFSLVSQAHLDLSFLALEFAHLGASLLLQSISHSGFGLPVLDLLRLGFFLFIRSYGCIDFSTSMLGLSCAGFVFPLFVTDAVHSGFILFSQGLSCCESVMFALDFLRLGFLPLAQSFACSGSTAPAIGIFMLRIAILSVTDRLRAFRFSTVCAWLCLTGLISVRDGSLTPGFLHSFEKCCSTELAIAGPRSFASGTAAIFKKFREARFCHINVWFDSGRPCLLTASH